MEHDDATPSPETSSTKHLPIRVGVFDSEAAADRAVSDLLSAGFAKERISVVSARPTPPHAEHEGVETVAPAGSHTAEGIAVGGTIGSVLGGLAAAAGVVATGGMGLMIVGPLLAASAVGGVAGGFVGAMMTRGFEPEIANFYDQALTKGQYLVAVEEDVAGPSLEVADAVFENVGADSMPMRKG
jgi:hypothetical protein